MIYSIHAESYPTAAAMVEAYAARRARLMGRPASVNPFAAVVGPEQQETRPAPSVWQIEPSRFDAHVAAWREWRFKRVVNHAKLHMQRRAEEMGFTIDQIIGPSRKRPIVAARQLLMYEVHTFYGKSICETGTMFRRDHTTAHHAIQKIGKMKAAGQ